MGGGEIPVNQTISTWKKSLLYMQQIGCETNSCEVFSNVNSQKSLCELWILSILQN